MVEDQVGDGGRGKEGKKMLVKRERKSSRVEIAPWWIRLTLESSREEQLSQFKELLEDLAG